MLTRHSKFRFYEHHVQKIVLPLPVDWVRYKFPLRTKYEKANVDIEALDHPVAASNDPLDAGDEPLGVDLYG